MNEIVHSLDVVFQRLTFLSLHNCNINSTPSTPSSSGLISRKSRPLPSTCRSMVKRVHFSVLFMWPLNSPLHSFFCKWKSRGHRLVFKTTLHVLVEVALLRA
uniref:(northern house mosquito) hypothetical protein n=1 Tax=Culex pipiens TaxID=7175 RepID=A0A8D8EZ71_CULPI